MNLATVLRVCLLAFVCSLFAAPQLLRAQETPPAAPSARCQPPAPLVATAGTNIFTAQQEMDLGDAIAEQVQRDFRVIEDDATTAHLRRIGDRIVRQMPQTGLQFRFFLFDIPEANAFTLPGGRIYVSRKLIALTRNEDELAGVLAHELGHAVTRQPATGMTRLLREVLGVTSVSDRQDIFARYNELVDNARRKPKAFNRGENHEQKEQVIADQIGLYALAAAGYDPQALSAFWDRFAETKGRTSGGFLSDLFGTTRPEVVRLREMLKLLGKLPPECITAKNTVSTEEFQKWQAAVINYSGLGGKEALHGVLSKTVLDPPLRSEVTHLRFSPDGKYLLAQDDSGINVLTREPFKILFRIDAPEALPAQFAPDSQTVSFATSGLRVESWNVAEQKQQSVKEMYVRDRCLQVELSPDGKALGCLEGDFQLTLFNVATGEPVFQKKSFYKPNFLDLFRLQLLAIFSDLEDSDDFKFNFIQMGFSPDAHYFVAAQRALVFTAFGTLSDEVVAAAVDLTTNAPVSLKGNVKKMLAGDFAFAAPDKLLTVNGEDFRKSALVSFPGGQVLEQFPIKGNLSNVASGNYVVVRPINNYRAGLFDLTSKKIVLANNQAAMDVYDKVFAAERLNGEIGLYNVGDNSLVTKVVLPRNPLGNLRASAVSSDMKWLAVSERSRGAVWDLSKGERKFHIFGFRGAHFAEDGSLYVDLPKYGNTERNVGRLALSTGETFEGVKTAEESSLWASQHGPFLLTMKPRDKEKESSGYILSARDARTGAPLWSQEFRKEAPRVWANPDDETLVFGWAVSTGAAKAEIQADPALKARLAQMREKEGDYFLQVVGARRGEVLSRLLIETGKGSFRIRNVFAVGEWIVISDSENRVLVYSLKTGEERGKAFGGRAAVARATGLLSVENERGQLTIYDLRTMEKRNTYNFLSPVSLARFSADGKRLFVLTANQTAYVLDLFAEKT
ncbi:MAG TPA: M48 family metalloprotease [Pyrinomonadaceae bacterium]|nr:M48 family metalloprotease [Pyrinomonadaceae bacterium]